VHLRHWREGSSLNLAISCQPRNTPAHITRAHDAHAVQVAPSTVPTMPVTAETVSPKAAALPPLPAEDPLTAPQWRTLLAIADAVIPAIKPISAANTDTEITATANEYSTALSTLQRLAPDGDGEAVAKAYLHDHATASPRFKEGLQRVIGLYLPQSNRKELATVLNILNTSAGSLLLTGYVTPISEQPAHVRHAILQGWGTARLPLLRQLQQSLTMLFKQTWIKSTEALAPMLGIPRVPIGMVPGKGFDYEFLQFPSGAEPEVIETDVVIVGSGCGGGVSAKNLAEAGYRVLVTEKAYHWTPDHFPMSEADGWNHLFMSGAYIQCTYPILFFNIC
jgi:hypothetical protein